MGYLPGARDAYPLTQLARASSYKLQLSSPLKNNFPQVSPSIRPSVLKSPTRYMYTLHSQAVSKKFLLPCFPSPSVKNFYFAH